MNAIEIEADIDDNNELHLVVPHEHKGKHARVIVLFADDNVPATEAAGAWHRPSPRLAGKGARLLGDDLAPAFSDDEWGSLAQ